MNVEFKFQQTIIEILTEGQFVWYTRDEIKKLTGLNQGVINESISKLLIINMVISKGGNGQSNPRKYALSSRVKGEIVNGSKVVSIKPLKGYHDYLFSKMHLCNSTR